MIYNGCFKYLPSEIIKMIQRPKSPEINFNNKTFSLINMSIVGKRLTTEKMKDAEFLDYITQFSDNDETYKQRRAIKNLIRFKLEKQLEKDGIVQQSLINDFRFAVENILIHSNENGELTTWSNLYTKYPLYQGMHDDAANTNSNDSCNTIYAVHCGPN